MATVLLTRWLLGGGVAIVVEVLAALSKSFLHKCAIIPAAKASPRTLIIVRNRSLRTRWRKYKSSQNHFHKTNESFSFIGTILRNSQDPVDGDNQRDVSWRQPHRGQDNHHGNQACLRYSSRANAGCRGCDTIEARDSAFRVAVTIGEKIRSLFSPT